MIAKATFIKDSGVIAGTAYYGSTGGQRGRQCERDANRHGEGSAPKSFLTDSETLEFVPGDRHDLEQLDVRLDALFLVPNGTMVNLNTLLPAGSGWVLQRPINISDAGEIVGVGTFNGSPSAFKLTPVPEPAAIVSAVAMTLWASARWRNRPG